MSCFLPQLVFLAAGGSIASSLLLLTILFLDSQSPLPHATALALGYFSTCAATGVVGLTVFGEAAGAGGAASMVSRVISATVGGLLIGLYAAVTRRASIMLRSLRIWRENNSRAITFALCFGSTLRALIRGLSGL